MSLSICWVSDPVLYSFSDEDKAVPILTSLTVQEAEGREKKPARPSWDRWSKGVPLVLKQAGLLYVPAEMGLVVEEHRSLPSLWLQLINRAYKSHLHEGEILLHPDGLVGGDPELVTKKVIFELFWSNKVDSGERRLS